MWKRSGYNPLRYFALADILLFIIIFSASLLSLLLAKALSPRGERVVVETEKGEYFSLPLSKDTTIYAEGPLGKTKIRIENDRAFIAYSPCPHKVCMRMGKIEKEGEVIVCVPNGVIVRIIGKGGLDGITR